MNDTLRAILDSGVIAIVRSDSSAGLLETVHALARGGVKAIEITMTTPGALDAITLLAREASEEYIIGAGSVLDGPMARSAIDSGAEFLVMPNVNLDGIRLAKDRGKVVCPGALTPTEIVTAWQAGADIVKIFPASCFGPEYILALNGPLPEVRYMPVGGVDLTNAAGYVKAGACAIAVGSALVNKKTIARGDWAQITETARKYVEAVARARSKGK